MVRTAVHKENEAPTLKPGEHGFVKRRLSPLEQARQPGEGITHESLVYRPLTPKELIALAAKKNFKKIA
ncbi:TPA: hypothetical protein HA244_04340 [Candidatus Micrarchaeota archaeon]|nr:hypothetical protein [Candidatus Micrarchaeota archaeon]